jgi:hypothetical protein
LFDSGQRGRSEIQVKEEDFQAIESTRYPNINKLVLGAYRDIPNSEDLLFITQKFTKFNNLTIHTLDAAPWISKSGLIGPYLFNSFFRHLFASISNFKFSILREKDIARFMEKY